MCTVTFVSDRDRLRAMCNRDERHTRPAAHPPVVTRSGGSLAIMPIDPQGGGTWVAANASGLVFAVLNASGLAGAPGVSRGCLIPALADCKDLRDVVARARPLCSRGWPGHRLVVADARRALELRLLSSGLVVDIFGLQSPLMFTSSSLGDALVEPVRRDLFERLVVGASDALDGQDAFHRHRWPGRAHVSVHMHRHDAGTHSITTVDVSPDRVRMRYAPRDLAGQPMWLSVERRGVRAESAATSAVAADVRVLARPARGSAHDRLPMPVAS